MRIFPATQCLNLPVPLPKKKYLIGAVFDYYCDSGEEEHIFFKIEDPKITFEDFSCTIFLDEDFNNYDECHTWITQGNPFLNDGNYVDPKIDGYLLVFNNTLKKIKKKFWFKGMFLTSIGSISYNNFGTEEITLDLSIAYTSFSPAST